MSSESKCLHCNWYFCDILKLYYTTDAARCNCRCVLGWALEAACWGDTTREMDNMYLCRWTTVHMRQHFRVSSRMGDMTQGQILIRAQAIMSDEKPPLEAAIQPVQSSTNQTSPTVLPSGSITYYKCSGLNHFVRDCQYQHGEESSGPKDRVWGKVWYYRCQKMGLVISECLGNGKRGKMSTQVSPHSILERCSPQLKHGLMGRNTLHWWTLVILCLLWLDRCVAPGVVRSWTANDEIIHGCSIGTIMLAGNNLNPIKADALVMDNQLLAFDMLLGMEIIKILCGVGINQSGEAIFNRTDPPACATISIKEPDFSTEFNEQIRVWTVCRNGQMIIHLMNLKTKCLLKSSKIINVSCGFGWIIDGCFPILRKCPSLKWLDSVDASPSTKLIQGVPLIGFPWVEWHVNVSMHMPTSIHTSWGSSKKGSQCVSVWSLKGLLVSECASIFVAIPNCYLQGKMVLLDTHGFGTM